ncbi:MAG: hypothetical protein EA381_03860 [Planctomycetaceae bacterium]|nr:MAG: hypothetical protein EA381_03860 [Planctomycetaceae bacterium]
MNEMGRPMFDEVDLLLDNARLRDELEPYIDDSFGETSAGRMSLIVENEYLASMLAWERAPAMPIAQWFEPPLQLPHPDHLDQDTIHHLLWQTIRQLHSAKIILECTDHLSDRQLYTLIYRDILPSCEKKVDLPRNYLHWRCLDDADDETWLRYYASPVERRRWQEEFDREPPPREHPPFPRQMPSRA